MDQMLSAAMAQPPTQADGGGFIYVYFLKDLHGRWIVKKGESTWPPRRKKEWDRQCAPQRHIWFEYALWVPWRKKMEGLLHLWATLNGAWLGYVLCRYCGVHHREQFDLGRCGGMWTIIRTAMALVFKQLIWSG
ncbi:hypothetical protein C8F04DRAFT_1175958 [Mycena alexandri]|uniref:Uncharacterized protein n=1 Tax=Mycena alexandri TaxID=1745969 RepID=A0AAD6XAM8_9AGAR|nr:hypothetical protein C8F04DRAFT_1175958 [Mycena alexandri]